ncbi:replication initiator protein [Microviridae sp.]|nr:replication initiator protein [Microviridae sp.]
MDKETGGIKFRREGTEETMEVACGQCLGCRLDRARMWAMRITHEASLHADSYGNSFVTLTYRPKEECNREQLDQELHIPEDWSLRKQHFQKFIKRLRKKLPDRKIKYFHCGEYGETCKHGINLKIAKCPLCNLGRPHYHACLFNVSFDDLEAYATTNGTTRYTSKMLDETWKYGFVDVGKLEYQSAAYVARYCLKKINGVNADDHYESVDLHGEITKLQPEYATMSNGVGKDWYQKYSADVFPSDEVPVPGVGVIKKAPRYYEEMLKKTDPELYELIKEKRKQYKLENPEEFEPGRLMSKYKVKKAQTEQLSRN